MDNQQTQHLAIPEEIWAMLRELTIKQEKSSEEADRRHKKAKRRLKKGALPATRSNGLIYEY